MMLSCPLIPFRQGFLALLLGGGFAFYGLIAAVGFVHLVKVHRLLLFPTLLLGVLLVIFTPVLILFDVHDLVFRNH